MAIKRQVFYSFHYKPDNWRASMVRNIGVVEGNRPATDNDWEEAAKEGNHAIKAWIDGQMKDKSCAIVLVGTHTANRKWIRYEILKAWENKMGIVGIHIHGLEDQKKHTSLKGINPFGEIIDDELYITMSSIVKCYDPQGANSQEKYAWIAKYLSEMVEEAIIIRAGSE